MGKKLLTLMLIPIIMLFAFSGIAAADGLDEESSAPLLKLDCRAALLMEYETGEVLFEQQADERYPMASVTKIMSLILIFEEIQAGRLSMTEKITISPTAAAMTGSEAFLDAGQQYTVSDLIKTIIVVSANDSVVAMAEHIAGDEDMFVQKMNARAQKMGLKNTHFMDCTGLSDENHYSSARDIAVMSKLLLSFPEYFTYSRIWTDTLTHNGGRITELTNTNKLVRFYEGADGVKTGYTSTAMHCISASAKRNNIRFIAVVLGAPSSDERFEAAKKMLNYGFANYSLQKLVEEGSEIANELRITGARQGSVKALVKSNISKLVQKGEEVKAERVITWNEGLCAPVKKGDVIGKISLYENGKLIGSSDIVAGEEIAEAGIGEFIKLILKNWKKQ